MAVTTPFPAGRDYAAVRARMDAADALEAAFVLREALRDLCHLQQMEDAGMAGRDQREQWRKAWAYATDVLGEEGG